ERVPKDTVLSADTGKVPKQSAVHVVVSDGPAPRTVPGMVGAKFADATRMLQGMHLIVAQDEEYSDDVDEGRVVRTDPPQGAQVPRDSTVTIYLSKGPEPVPVPRVRGMSLEGATKKLEAAGF